MKSRIFGVTTSGLPIPAYEFGTSGPRVLILGGVHGDETEGVKASLGLLREFSKGFPFALQLTLVPAFNQDGVLANTRHNARGVDLNRNLPTSDWTMDETNPRYYPGPQAASEAENQELINYLSSHRPQFILSLHSWKPCLNVNGKCRKQADAISAHTGYEIVESIGYPTPGCLGTYAGIEHEMPTLTYEIERGLATAEIVRVHVPAVLEALKVTERPIG